MQIVDDATIEKNADRVLERVSPSQVETFEMCPRRWYNQSIRGLREETTPAQQRGTDIGAEVEYFYTEGKGKLRDVVKFRDMVEPVLPLLGPFSQMVSVEQWVGSPTFEGGPILRGRYDHFDAAHETRVLGTAPMPMLSDIKSRSDFRYCKTEAELAEDLQLNAYAVPIMLEHNLDEIALQHAYTRTKKDSPKGRAVRVVVTRKQLESRFQKTIESIRQMTRWAKERPRTADPLPPNTAACSKFPPHGCPHKALCGFSFRGTEDKTFQIRRENIMDAGNGTSDLTARLKQRTAELLAKKTGTPAPVPVVAEAQKGPPPRPMDTPGVAPAQKADPIKEARAKILAGTLRLDGSGQVYDKAGADAGWITRQPTMAERIAFEEEAKKAAPAEATQDERIASGLEELGLGEQDGPAILAPDAPPRTNQPGDVEATEKPKKERKTRTSKAASSVAFATTVSDNGPVVGVRIGDPAEIGPVVYVDCVPVKGKHAGRGILFEQWMAPICEAVAAGNKDKNGQPAPVADWRMIQYTAKGDLAAAVRACIETLRGQVVLVSRMSPAADVFLESVIPWADEIVQRT